MGQQLATYNWQSVYNYDTVQGPLPGNSLWERFAGEVAVSDPFPYVVYQDDFVAATIADNTIPGWTFTSATSGAITQDTTSPNGVLLISAGAATANQGVNWQLNHVPFRVATNKPVAFEVYGKFTGLSNLRLQAFLGLAATSTAVISAGAVAAIDRIGFQGVVTNGVLSAVARGGGTAATSSGVTLVNTTPYRFGFFATSSQVDFYVNGSIVSSATTQIPTGALAPTIVVQANGTDTPVFNVDYLRVAGFR